MFNSFAIDILPCFLIVKEMQLLKISALLSCIDCDVCTSLYSMSSVDLYFMLVWFRMSYVVSLSLGEVLQSFIAL